MDVKDTKFQIAIPTILGQPKAHSHIDDGIYGHFDGLVGSFLWELSEIEITEGDADSEARTIGIREARD